MPANILGQSEIIAGVNTDADVLREYKQEA